MIGTILLTLFANAVFWYFLLWIMEGNKEDHEGFTEVWILTTLVSTVLTLILIFIGAEIN